MTRLLKLLEDEDLMDGEVWCRPLELICTGDGYSFFLNIQVLLKIILNGAKLNIVLVKFGLIDQSLNFIKQ
jgi:hypothetical protein